MREYYDSATSNSKQEREQEIRANSTPMVEQGSPWLQ
jgi:hypothetical protein